MSRVRAAIAVLGIGFALPALAEGAVQEITCVAAATCDAGGACEAGGADASFRLTPRDVNEFGAGAYRLGRGDVEVDAVMRPDMSLIWAEGPGDLQMLTLLDATAAIWVRRSRLDTDGPGATVAFVACAEAS